MLQLDVPFVFTTFDSDNNDTVCEYNATRVSASLKSLVN